MGTVRSPTIFMQQAQCHFDSFYLMLIDEIVQ